MLLVELPCLNFHVFLSDMDIHIMFPSLCDRSSDFLVFVKSFVVDFQNVELLRRTLLMTFSSYDFSFYGYN